MEESTEPLPEILFNKLSEQYRRYQVCGGLPKPCSDMLDGAGMQQVETDLDNLRQAYESALDWLVLSGMVYRIHVCKKPQLPFKHYEDTNAFKVYVLDQAILRTMSELPPEAVIAKGDLLKEFKGAMAENFVLGSLLAQGYKTPHYRTHFVGGLHYYI